MYSQFNTSSVKGGNSGSSSNLTNYLDKEVKNEWFNDERKDIKTKEVTSEIDRYGKGQGFRKTEWRFVEVEYNPSHKEQQQIIYEATGRENVNEWKDLTPAEKEKVKDEFKEYVIEAQNIQALNFNKEALKSGADLKYYGKVETQRTYKGTDEKVILGQAKQGDLKQGLHLHAHIVQSRVGKSQKGWYAPTSIHKGKSSKNKIKQGFNRKEFINKIEQKFDEKFNNKRDIKDTFEWKNANKHNRIDELKSIENRNEITHSDKRKDYLKEFRNDQNIHKLDRAQIFELRKELRPEPKRGYSR